MTAVANDELWTCSYNWLMCKYIYQVKCARYWEDPKMSKTFQDYKVHTELEENLGEIVKRIIGLTEVATKVRYCNIRGTKLMSILCLGRFTCHEAIGCDHELLNLLIVITATFFTLVY